MYEEKKYVLMHLLFLNHVYVSLWLYNEKGIYELLLHPNHLNNLREDPQTTPSLKVASDIILNLARLATDLYCEGTKMQPSWMSEV